MSKNEAPTLVEPRLSSREKETPAQETQPRKYAVLQETSGEECESWYYFIKYQGNEEALDHLNKQLEQVDWYIVDDLSTFDLELDYLVSEQTAKEMTKVDINHTSFHRKFDGTLQKIDLKFKSHHDAVKKMEKAYSVLGYGGIENFIDQEDIDPEDMKDIREDSESSEEEDEEDDEESDEDEAESEESEDSEEDSEESEEEAKPLASKKVSSTSKVQETSERSEKLAKKGHLPVKPKFDIPRVAKAKQHRKH